MAQHVATWTFLLTLAVSVCAWPRNGLAQEDVRVQGEVVDLLCYLTKGNHGPADQGCAKMCAKKGEPVGLLTDDGQLYLLVDDHNNPDPYDVAKTLGGKRTDVSGKKFNKQGVASIVVESIKGL